MANQAFAEAIGFDLAVGGLPATPTSITAPNVSTRLRLLDRKLADGALAGLASGLADVASAKMLRGIDKTVGEGTMTAGFLR